MLRREDELRRAPDTQASMGRAEESVKSEWMDVVAEVQRRVVQEFQESSFSSAIITVGDLREAALRNPDLAHWVKYNRARRGGLKVGDTAPDVPVRRAATCEETTLLSSSSDSGKPVVIAAGSLS